MNVGIVTPVWGRLKTTALWYKGVQRLQEQWSPHTVRPFVSGNEPEHRELCAANGGVWVEQENVLGKKFNASAEAAWKWGADYIVILGSDDLISPKLAERYMESFLRGPTYFGLRNCYMVEPTSKRALFLSGHAHPSRIGETVGVGRSLSKAALDRVRGRPWPDGIARGADFRMTMKLLGVGVKGTDFAIEKEDGAFALDVKGAGNIWKFDGVQKHTHVASDAVYEYLLSFFPEGERAMIRELEHAACPTCGHLRPW